MVTWRAESARFGEPAAKTTASGGRRAVRRFPSFGRLPKAVSAARSRVRRAVVRWTVIARTRGEAGMSTAEYAVGTIAACGFAALLFKIVTSNEVRSMLTALIQKALKLAG
ncbi:hypothetical protein Pth03_20860 [Planotetraspora thailandica]|uniref:DUF4244 domain-containing protein n=1 Tax=Planotetraspora thailandica TaxID=487172 RepID=A0A8J3V1A8_9ACTN|nr:DUF4244 domain-containing protein [Planotetraspora thailandica]GII53697.1 hypothetical protein Pth03_20860 [Planotetraspora thailandica]